MSDFFDDLAGDPEAPKPERKLGLAVGPPMTYEQWAAKFVNKTGTEGRKPVVFEDESGKITDERGNPTEDIE